MLINEVIQTVKESYYEDLIVAIQNELTLRDKEGEISTIEFNKPYQRIENDNGVLIKQNFIKDDTQKVVEKEIPKEVFVQRQVQRAEKPETSHRHV